jgi:hypothetical protein
MRLGRILFVTTILCSSVSLFAWAQEAVLWREINPNSATVIPTYDGGESPFPPRQQAATPRAEGAEIDTAALLANALSQARNLVRPANALVPMALSAANGLTNGAKGPRVLVRGDWLGVGDSVALRYRINPETRTALQELQQLDADAAAKLANELETVQRAWQEQQAKVEVIDVEGKKITLRTPLGPVALPVILAP